MKKNERLDADDLVTGSEEFWQNFTEEKLKYYV